MSNRLPGLPVDTWRDTYATVHLWMQIVGKIRLAQAPMLNHWWQTTLYVTPRGLTTSAMPHGERTFEIDFDFVEHRLSIRSSTGETRSLRLEPRSVASFYRELMSRLDELDLAVRIWPRPVEIPETTRLDEDEAHASYDAPKVELFRQHLIHAARILGEFRSGFIGKSSPVHFFWGGFDLAVTRFSGRPAPEHPGGAPNVGRWVMVEGYSHELASFGWWPGSGKVKGPAFYAYAYPEPEGFSAQHLRTAGAHFDHELGLFLLPVDALESVPDPDRAVLDFCNDVYEAAANLGSWDRQTLERFPVRQ